MDTKKNSYYKELYTESFKYVWGKFGMIGILFEGILLTVSIMGLILAGSQVDFFVESFLLWLIAFIVALFLIPILSFFNMFRITKSREESKDKELDKFTGKIKAKLKSKEIKQDDGHVGFHIKNIEDFDIEQCTGRFLSLEYIKDGDFSRYKEEDVLDDINPNGLLLTWGAGSKDGMVTIPKSGGKKLSNLARHLNNNLVFMFQGLHGEVPVSRSEQGIYQFQLRIDGKAKGRDIEGYVFKGHIEFQRYYKRENKSQEMTSTGIQEISIPVIDEVDFYKTKLEIRKGYPNA